MAMASRHRARGPSNLTLLLAFTFGVLISTALGRPTTRIVVGKTTGEDEKRPPVYMFEADGASVANLVDKGKHTSVEFDEVKDVSGALDAGKNFIMLNSKPDDAVAFFELESDAKNLIEKPTKCEGRVNIFWKQPRPEDEPPKNPRQPPVNKKDQTSTLFVGADYAQWQEWYKHAVFFNAAAAKMYTRASKLRIEQTIYDTYA